MPKFFPQIFRAFHMYAIRITRTCFIQTLQAACQSVRYEQRRSTSSATAVELRSAGARAYVCIRNIYSPFSQPLYIN